MSACLSGACFLHLLAPQWLHRTPLPDVLALPPYLTWVLSSPCPAQVLDVLDRLFVHMFQVGRWGDCCGVLEFQTHCCLVTQVQRGQQASFVCSLAPCTSAFELACFVAPSLQGLNERCARELAVIGEQVRGSIYTCGMRQVRT